MSFLINHSDHLYFMLKSLFDFLIPMIKLSYSCSSYHNFLIVIQQRISFLFIFYRVYEMNFLIIDVKYFRFLIIKLLPDPSFPTRGF